jgi:hypothetical protein
MSEDSAVIVGNLDSEWVARILESCGPKLATSRIFPPWKNPRACGFKVPGKVHQGLGVRSPLFWGFAVSEPRILRAKVLRAVWELEVVVRGPNLVNDHLGWSSLGLTCPSLLCAKIRFLREPGLCTPSAWTSGPQKPRPRSSCIKKRSPNAAEVSPGGQAPALGPPFHPGSSSSIPPKVFGPKIRRFCSGGLWPSMFFQALGGFS